MTLSRREFVRSAAAVGAMFMARPLVARAGHLAGPDGSTGAARVSRLFPGTFLAHADLHNHSHLSDGDGDPQFAFASMLEQGLDVAALTDHSSLSWSALGLVDPCAHVDSNQHGQSGECQSLLGIHEAAWQRAGTLADAANGDSFVAVRGFEWSSPFLGHMNVWFSQRWIDPLHTLGWSPSHVPQDAHEYFGIPVEMVQALDEVVRLQPARGSGMQPFYRWLNLPPDTPVLGGGLDGIAGFNHPGRETGRFDFFKHVPEMRDRVVSMEIFNRKEDYLFEAYAAGRPSPLVECLDAGWRVGLIGVTDEHGVDWGGHDTKGRAGVWVDELSRDGVKRAMTTRRVFAARVLGLRVDASANGVRMGNSIGHSSGTVRFALDVDRGPEHWGEPVRVQVLRPGGRIPSVVAQIDTTLRSESEPVIEFDVPLDARDGNWVVLRILDPTQAKRDEQGPTDAPWDKFSIAYTSPWWLNPVSTQST